MFSGCYTFLIPGHDLGGNCVTFGYLTGKKLAAGTIQRRPAERGAGHASGGSSRRGLRSVSHLGRAGHSARSCLRARLQSGEPRLNLGVLLRVLEFLKLGVKR